jgi:hypothetical protein
MHVKEKSKKYPSRSGNEKGMEGGGPAHSNMGGGGGILGGRGFK